MSCLGYKQTPDPFDYDAAAHLCDAIPYQPTLEVSQVSSTHEATRPHVNIAGRDLDESVAIQVVRRTSPAVTV